MHHLHRLIAGAGLAIVILACEALPAFGVPTAGVRIIVAATLRTAAPATQESPAAPVGLSVTYQNVSLVIPPGLATGTTNSTTADVEFPYVNPSAGDMPLHSKIVLNGYPLEGTMFQPQITVFGAAEYAQYGSLTRNIILALQRFQDASLRPLPEGLDRGYLSAQPQPIGFANGHALRYLSQFDPAPLPVNNHELIYYFQGLTADGSDYVQGILPVQAPFLAADDNPASPLPPGGVPFDMNELYPYLDAVTRKLDATAADQFTPSLLTLDALIQSIRVTP